MHLASRPAKSLRHPIATALCALAIGPLLGCESLPRDADGNLLLEVRSHPSGATVRLRDGRRGTTPATFAVTPGTEIRLRVELDGYESVLTRAKPSGAAAGRAAAARGGLYGVIEGHARGAHLALVPNPIAVDLVPVGEKLPELPAERERVNGLLAGCKKPIDVREDCSLWDGARRLVRVRAKQMLVAGRDESGGVFVMPYDPDPAEYQASKTEPALDPCNRVYREVTTVLGARLERAIDVMFTGTQLGCYLQFDRPVYSHLRSLSVEP